MSSRDLDAAATLAQRLAGSMRSLENGVKETIQLLLDHGRIDEAARIVQALGPFTHQVESALWQLVYNLFYQRRFESASRAASQFRLQRGLHEFCGALLAEQQFNLAFTWTSVPEAALDAVQVISAMLLAGNLEGALKQIADRGLTGCFPATDLFVWCQLGLYG